MPLRAFAPRSDKQGACHHASHDLAPAAETDNHLVVYERRCLDLYDLCNMCDALKLLVMLAFLSVLAAPVVVWVVEVSGYRGY